jgi:hypothetical protein
MPPRRQTSEKPLQAESWWIEKPRDGFTRAAEQLWNDRQPRTAAGIGMELWPHEKRKSEYAA